jgi:hypothetical protein
MLRDTDMLKFLTEKCYRIEEAGGRYSVRNDIRYENSFYFKLVQSERRQVHITDLAKLRVVVILVVYECQKYLLQILFQDIRGLQVH